MTRRRMLAVDAPRYVDDYQLDARRMQVVEFGCDARARLIEGDAPPVPSRELVEAIACARRLCTQLVRARAAFHDHATSLRGEAFVTACEQRRAFDDAFFSLVDAWHRKHRGQVALALNARLVMHMAEAIRWYEANTPARPPELAPIFRRERLLANPDHIDWLTSEGRICLRDDRVRLPRYRKPRARQPTALEIRARRVTVEDAAVLAAIRTHPRSSGVALTKVLRWKNGVIAGALSRLEAAGLIRNVSNSASRQKWLAAE